MQLFLSKLLSVGLFLHILPNLMLLLKWKMQTAIVLGRKMISREKKVFSDKSKGFHYSNLPLKMYHIMLHLESLESNIWQTTHLNWLDIQSKCNGHEENWPAELPVFPLLHWILVTIIQHKICILSLRMTGLWEWTVLEVILSMVCHLTFW